MMDYVRLTTVARVMGVNISWLRGLVYQKVMDDERESRTKGSPHVMHVQQCFQAIVARRMRERRIGYDLVRDAIWDLEIDRQKRHEVKVATGIKLVLNKSLLLLEARSLLKEANDWEYGTEDEQQAA